MAKTRLAAALWVLGLIVVGIQALALASRYFQPWLSADYIYPQLFAEDVLAGRYPLAGWTLSSAPYFFPDMIVMIGLCGLAGEGTVLPAYVVFYYLSLAVLCGWSLRAVTQRGWSAWVGGAALVNFLLAWQPVGDHAHYLWLLGTVGFHGGAILLGLATVALWVGPVDQAPSRWRWWAGVGVLLLGAMSDMLFLTQAAAPFAISLWAVGGWGGRGLRLRAYLKALGVALLGVILLRVLLAVVGVFHFSKVIRYAPTPSAVWQAVTTFYHDGRTVLLFGMWGLLIPGLIAAVCWGWGRRLALRAPEAQGRTGLWPVWFVGVALASTLLFPLLTAYWRDEHHIRYLLPILVLPSWLVMLWILRATQETRVMRGLGVLVGALFMMFAALAGPGIRAAALRWPYTETQAQLDQFLAERHLTHGFSDYWRAHQINTLTRSPVRLFALRPEGRAFFWNNNAYWFYDISDGQGVELTLPSYSFIITDGLKETALLQRFGEPQSKERVAGLTLWLYTESGSRRTLTDSVHREVQTFLTGRPGAERLPKPPFAHSGNPGSWFSGKLSN